jgi:16S rRNA G966 N2-methylase RsmD
MTAKQLTPEQLSGGADVVFIDPPFKMLGVEAIVEAVFERNLVTPEGIVVWEYPARVPPQPLAVSGISCIDTRHYGDASVVFYERDRRA